MKLIIDGKNTNKIGYNITLSCYKQTVRKIQTQDSGQQTSIMNTLSQQEDTVFLSQIFNEEEASMQFQNKLKLKPHFNKVSFNNVSIKVMREALKQFEEQAVEHIDLQYDWNEIMVMPKLVCYDKNTWKTLQQLANWNREWTLLFGPCYNLQSVQISLTISWMDDQFIKSFLEGLTRLPNIKSVVLSVKCKDEAVRQMLEAFQKAQIFASFDFKFQKM